MTTKDTPYGNMSVPIGTGELPDQTGSAGKFLQTDGAAASWEDVADVDHGIPVGGTTGQVLTKASNTDYDADWENGGSGAVREYAFPFVHNTVGLAAGVPFYTPTIGDWLLDGRIEVDAAWNGTTPQGDLGQLISGDTNGVFGIHQASSVPMDIADVADGTWAPTGLLTQGNGGSLVSDAAFAQNSSLTKRVFPCKITDATPFKVWVTQTGAAGGADPGATQGAGVVYLLISTPIPSPG